jgi:hypothetical protein
MRQPHLLEKITVEQSILKLFAAIDAHSGVMVAAAFSADGVWIRHTYPCAGRDAIIDAMDRRPADRAIQHLISNFIVKAIDRTQAQTSFTVLAYADDRPIAGEPSPMSLPIALDRYDATLVNCDGTWLVSHLAGDRLFVRKP